MDNKNVLNEIRSFLLENSNEETRLKYARYFKEGFDSYGVVLDVFMAKKNELLEKYVKTESLNNVIDFGTLLLKSGKYEEGSLAIMFLIPFKKQFSSETLNLLERWLDNGISNWAHCDYFCSEILSVFYKKKIVNLDSFSSWRKAESKWKRRATPVGMLKYLKEEHNISEILKFLEIMMDDKERVVHQGLGWFLREAWKKHPEEVEKFLQRFKNTSARLIFQYATEKMSKEYRLQFRKEKEIKDISKK